MKIYEKVRHIQIIQFICDVKRIICFTYQHKNISCICSMRHNSNIHFGIDTIWKRMKAEFHQIEFPEQISP